MIPAATRLSKPHEVLKTYITGEFRDLAHILELRSITVVHAVASVVSEVLLVLHLSEKNA